MIIYKACSKCHQSHPITDFTIDRARADGRSYHCKKCRLKFERIRNGHDPDRPMYGCEVPFNRKQHRIDNHAYYTAKSNERRARKLNATPKWLTAEHHQQIIAIYKEGKEKGMHVDHDIPLLGKTVCGLHVPWNLQLLTPADNRKKSNKLTS